MTDEELAAFLGIAGHPKAAAVIAGLTPKQRRLYERMSEVEMEATLWEQGLGPKPTGVLLDYDRKAFR